MSLVDAVVLDGNKYLISDGVDNNSKVGTAQGFDGIYNKISDDMTYDEIFSIASARTGVDINLLKAVAQAESGCRADATSSCGAMGVMQLMPATAEAYGVEDPYNAYDNIMGGARLLSDLLKRYNGNVTLTLASYNAGSGNVSKYGGVPPFKETTNYIARINKLLDGALDNDSTTLEGAKPTDLGSTSNSAISAYNYSSVTLGKKVAVSNNVTDAIGALPVVKHTADSESNVSISKSLSQIALELLENENNESASSKVVYDAGEQKEEMVWNVASKSETGKEVKTDVFDTVNPYVLSGTQGINSILRSNVKGLYEAQAVAVSPLIAKIKEI